ncbi:unnamed protein product, partial [Closterium sp. NIES-54]
DVTFDESVPFYRLFPFHSAPPPPLPLFLAPGPTPVDPLLPQGPAPSGVSQVDNLPGTAPVQVAAPGAAPGAASGGATYGGSVSGGAEPGGVGSEVAGSGGAEPGGAEPEGVEPRDAESEGAESGGAEPRGAASSGDTGAGGDAVTTGAGSTGGAVAIGPEGARPSGAGAARTGCVGCAGDGDPTEPGAAGAGGAGARGAGVGGPGEGGAGATGARVGGPGAGGAGAAVGGAVDPGAGAAGGTSGGLTECREPAPRPFLPVRTARYAPRSRPPLVPYTHTMALRPSSVPLCVPLHAPPESSLPEVPDPASDCARAASPTVARTSMIHAAAPHFLWPFAVQYAAHQINLQPRVSLPETTPTLRWTGNVGDASAFRVDPAEPVEVAVDSSAARGADPAGAGTGGAESRGVESGGAETGRAETGHAEPGGVAPEGTMSGGAEPARAASGGALGVPSRREPLSPLRLREWYSRRCRVAARGAAGAAGAGAAGGAAGAGGATRATGGAGSAVGGASAGAAGGAAGAGAVGSADAAGGGAGAGAAGGAAGAGAAGAARGAGATGGGAGAGAAGGAAVAGGASAGAAGGAVWLRPYYFPLLQQVLGSPPSPGPPPPFLSPPPVQSQSQLQPAPPLPGPSPYSGLTRGLTERRAPESRPVSPASRSVSPARTVRAGCVSRPRLPPVPGTHSMTLRPSTTSQRVLLPSPPASSLPDGPDPESDSLRAASPTVTRFLATAVTDPLFESSVASLLVAELVDFAAACRLDYATSLVASSASVCPPSVGAESALGTDVLEDRQEDLECFAAASPHLVSMLLAPEGDPDALDIPTPRSYAEAIEGPYSSQCRSRAGAGPRQGRGEGRGRAATGP